MILGYLATSGAKSDIIFLLSNPDFAPILLTFRDLTQKRRQTWQLKQKAFTL